ncbi:HlyD family secretion protein [Pseudoxanthomonas putridarboris]|uniref:Efflux RND transporter periplasmic adaptor subunit n=1 Tax=Pseudoxanthomonas putridarboris TaxID=752605 RepID=A0ABU9J1Q3_9GAMM
MSDDANSPPKPRDDDAPVRPDARARRLRPLVLLALGGIVALGVWLAFRGGQDLVQGMADADNINVSAKITARVRALHVHEGDRVKAGQVLFELDSPEVKAKQQQVEAVLEAAQAQADKAEEGARTEDIRAARANWERAVAGNVLAQSTWKRMDALHREGVVTRQRRDEALAQARSSASMEAAARAQYDEALSGARRQDREAAQAQVRQAQGAVAEVKAAEDETLGRAPSPGEVGKRMADVGELVPAGFPVFTLVDLERMWVSLNLREDQFKGMSMGKRLHGDIPALGLEAVEFEVYFISPAGDYATWRATRQSSGYDVKSFEVRVRPVQRVADFRPGMSVLFPWPQS